MKAKEDSKAVVKDLIAKAQKEIGGLLAESRTGKINKRILEAGLKDLQGRLKVMSVHNHKADVDDSDDV